MATTKNITMKQFNGTDYDTLYPKTRGSQITGAVPITSGGTGGTNAKTGMYNLLNGMSTITPATNDLFPFKDVSGSTSGLVTLANLITAMGNNGVITTSNLSTQASNLGFSKIQTGSYVGTGTYGESNPCSITFDFVPESLIIYSSPTTSTDIYCVPFSFIHVSSVTNSYDSGKSFIAMGYRDIQFKNMFGLQLKLINKTIYWYARSSDYDQLNGNGQVYKWIALG